MPPDRVGADEVDLNDHRCPHGAVFIFMGIAAVANS
jgi:hypothetical protein